MRYLVTNQSTVNGKKQLMLNLAVAALTGTVDQDILQTKNGETENISGTNLGIAPLTTFESSILPTNGLSDADIYVLQKSSTDTSRNVPTEAKARKGDLILLIGAGLAVDETGNMTDEETNLHNLSTELDTISTDWEVTKIGVLNSNTNSLGGPYIGASNASYYIGWGFLKDTQTQSFNPLDSVSVSYDYIMVNPDSIIQQSEAIEQANLTSDILKNENDRAKKIQAKIEED